MPDAWGLSFLPTLPFGFAPEAPSDDRELISLNPPVPEGSGAGRTGEGMLGEGLFDAAATGCRSRCSRFRPLAASRGARAGDWGVRSGDLGPKRGAAGCGLERDAPEGGNYGNSMRNFQSRS